MGDQVRCRKVGFITIGQSPRVDMVPEMVTWLGSGVQPLERGALDGLAAHDIAALAPRPNDYALITRIADGSSVTIAKRHILPQIQATICELEENGTDAVLLGCTGHFPPFHHDRPLLTAGQLLVNGVKAIAQGTHVGVICPLPQQEQLTRDKWGCLTQSLNVSHGSPYGDLSDLRRAAHELKEARVEYVILDCMGYTQAMKDQIRAVVGVPVLLARSVVARLLAEVLC